jgi:hypothetical protein
MMGETNGVHVPQAEDPMLRWKVRLKSDTKFETHPSYDVKLKVEEREFIVYAKTMAEVFERFGPDVVESATVSGGLDGDGRLVLPDGESAVLLADFAPARETRK